MIDAAGLAAPSSTASAPPPAALVSCAYGKTLPVIVPVESRSNTVNARPSTGTIPACGP
ncbi:hypothetical protein [Capillimicrobium parvum]|uniref:hypothetical protein n=1 Tax=Capillimicrobium parvum TaxID=2884022 RepID=UPI00216AE4E8|nr:hypothetical protein [Capillimicrobium parvum]